MLQIYCLVFSQSSIFDLIYSVWHFAIAQITNLNDLNHFPEEQYSNFVQMCNCLWQQKYN